jgi:glycerol kinase
VFVLAHTDGPSRVEGLLPTVAWAGADGEVHHALDGGVFAAGSLLEWLAGLGLAPDPPALAALAASVQDCGGVRVLPAIAGLGAPWWQPRARGVIAGLHGGTRAAHVAHAALHAVAMRVADIVEAVERAGPVRELRADGGLSNDALLMQMQADALGRPVLVGPADATVLGAAMLAGVGAGTFADVAQAARVLAPGRTVEPCTSGDDRARARESWREFLAAASAL